MPELRHIFISGGQHEYGIGVAIKSARTGELWQHHRTLPPQIVGLAEIVAKDRHEVVAHPIIAVRIAGEFDGTQLCPRTPVHHGQSAWQARGEEWRAASLQTKLHIIDTIL